MLKLDHFLLISGTEFFSISDQQLLVVPSRRKYNLEALHYCHSHSHRVCHTIKPSYQYIKIKSCNWSKSSNNPITTPDLDDLMAQSDRVTSALMLLRNS